MSRALFGYLCLLLFKPHITDCEVLLFVEKGLSGCRQRASKNLTVALAPDDFKPASELGPGDFLVRGLAGFDTRAGVLLVGGGARLVSTLSIPHQDFGAGG